MRFQTRYSVTIDRPVGEVFDVLATAPHVERVVRLSPILTTFTLRDVRDDDVTGVQVVGFEFGERVPVLPGYAADVTMRVEQTVDRGALRVDYRSRSQQRPRLTVHKVRTFEPTSTADDSPATRVTEVIIGDCAPGLHLLAGRSARKAHVVHMDAYATLFTA